MSVKSFVGAAKKQDAKKALGRRPVLVFFYMIGCPHCEATKPAWDNAKKEVPEDTEILEIDAEATPEDEGISGFPTMRYVDRSGKKKEISGEKTDKQEILNGLGVSAKGGSRRRRSLRWTHRRRDRKLRHRTLRNYVPLRKQFVRPSVLPEKF